MRLVLLKIGGSLITDKRTEATVQSGEITRLAREIREALSEDGNLSLILGNGAGSFGHIPAARHGTADGLGKGGAMGFAKVHRSAALLNRLVVDALLAEGVPAISMQPSAFILSRGNERPEAFIDPIGECAKRWIVPVVYGDTILDSQTGSTILSTDAILELIAKGLSESGWKNGQ